MAPARELSHEIAFGVISRLAAQLRRAMSTRPVAAKKVVLQASVGRYGSLLPGIVPQRLRGGQ